MDPEQAKNRELFQTLEREAKKNKATRRSGKVGGGIVSAGCAAVLAVYATGYGRTQSAADRFTKQLSVRHVAALTLPGVSVTLNRKDVADPKVEVDSQLAPAPVPDVSLAKPLRVKSAEPEPEPAARAEPHAESAPLPTPDSTTPAAPTPVAPASSITPAAPAPALSTTSAPPPAIDRTADVPNPQPMSTSAPKAVWKDGTYTGWGYSRHGNIEAQVIIESGRITSATISQCRTRYSCSVIEQLPPQVAQRQSPEVDYVSGATQSADAFYGAVVEALAKAK